MPHKDLEKRKQYHKNYNKEHGAKNMRHWRKDPKNRKEERRRYFSDRYVIKRTRYLELRRLRKYGLTKEDTSSTTKDCIICQSRRTLTTKPANDRLLQIILEKDILWNWWT